MSSGDRNVQFVTKLHQMTQHGAISWQAIEPPKTLTEGTDDKVPGPVYVANVEGSILGVFEARYTDYAPDYDQFYWTSRIALVVFDSQSRVIYTFPRVAGLGDLYDAVQAQTAGVPDILDKLLKK